MADNPMGQQEHLVRTRVRNAKIKRAVLTALVVAVAGGLNPTMLVNGILRELKTDKHKRRLAQNAVYVARQRMLRQGLVEFRDGLLRITDEGKNVLCRMEANDYQIKKPRRWDKKWRMLIFDIKEKQKGLRNKIRNTLVSIGFRRLQDSVWVFPYDCEDFIVLLKADFHVGKDLLYVIADTIENDGWLRKEFGLV